MARRGRTTKQVKNETVAVYHRINPPTCEVSNETCTRERIEELKAKAAQMLLRGKQTKRVPRPSCGTSRRGLPGSPRCSLLRIGRLHRYGAFTEKPTAVVWRASRGGIGAVVRRWRCRHRSFADRRRRRFAGRDLAAESNPRRTLRPPLNDHHQSNSRR